MAVISKWFKIATEGETADGREIEKQWLIDIADTYDRKEREASIFLDHYRYYGNYGTVIEVKLGKDNKERTSLYARIEPTINLLKLNAEQQYKYPSIGVITNFQKSGKAYLGHLGAVQDPASVAIEPINYANTNGEEESHLCFASKEPIIFELEPEKKNFTIPDWFKNFLNNTDTDDMSQEQLTQLSTQLNQLQNDFSVIKQNLGINEETPNAGGDDANFSQQLKDMQSQIDTLKKPEHKNGDEDYASKIAVLEEKLTDFGSTLEAALKESKGTPTPDHTGSSGNNDFSIV